MLKLLLAISAFLSAVTGCSRKEAASIGIIGGVDGPTAIYVAKELGIVRLLSATLIVFSLGAFIGYKVYKKRKK